VRSGVNLARVVFQDPAPGPAAVVVPLPPGLYLFATPAAGDDWTRTRTVRVMPGEDADVAL
jgi:hypothetical protein